MVTPESPLAFHVSGDVWIDIYRRRFSRRIEISINGYDVVEMFKKNPTVSEDWLVVKKENVAVGRGDNP